MLVVYTILNPEICQLFLPLFGSSIFSRNREAAALQRRLDQSIKVIREQNAIVPFTLQGVIYFN